MTKHCPLVDRNRNCIVNSDNKKRREKKHINALFVQRVALLLFLASIETGSLNSDVSSFPPRWPHMRREPSHLLEIRSEQGSLAPRAKWHVKKEPTNSSFSFATVPSCVSVTRCLRNSSRRLMRSSRRRGMRCHRNRPRSVAVLLGANRLS